MALLVLTLSTNFYLILLAIIAICCSIFVAGSLYNCIFHPLAHVPGPLSAKIAGARHLSHVWRGDLHTDVWRCHQRYGPVVRYAPSKIVFNSPTAVQAIYPTHRGVRKADGYDTKPFTRDQASLFNTIDPAAAAFKKKLLMPANGEAAQSLHESSVLAHTQTLVDLVSSREQFNMSNLAFKYALDTVSQSILGASFDLMKHDHNSWLPFSIMNGNRHMYLQLTNPGLFKWLGQFLDISRVTYPKYHEEGALFVTTVRETLERGTACISNLLHAANANLASSQELEGEAFTLIRAGGDTVAAALASFFFYITRSPTCYERLRQEILSTFADRESIRTGSTLNQCTYLRACMDEALRMGPPGPGIFWRQSSTDLCIDGVFVPAGTEIGVGVYAIHHNEHVFPEPFRYTPERFLQSGSRDGFIPFLRGFRSCPAQKLAYTMMLLPIAHLIWVYDFKAVGEVGSGIKGAVDVPEAEGVFQQRDMFSAKVDGPSVMFTSRRA